MLGPPRARTLVLAGIAAAAAAVAHAGPAAFAEPRWAAPALAGAVAAIAGLALTARVVAALTAAARDPGRVGAPRFAAPAPGIAATAATLLAAQAAAHAALLAAGVPGHAGAGSVTLHVVLAAAGALVVHGGDRLVAAAAGRLDAAVARLVARLAGAAPVPRSPTGRPPAAARGRTRPPGRAPPAPA
jgi:hypothetical protein